ncbi:energy transducer TonB [Myroides sp. LJL119]
MKILQNDSERKSFAITSSLFVVLLLLCFFWTLPKSDQQPVLTGGEIAINFGTSNVGKGQVQPKQVAESQPVQEVSPQVQPVQSEPVVTQKVVETPVVAKTEPVVNPKQTTPEIQKNKPEVEPEKKPSQSTQDALASLINGPKVSGDKLEGQGDTNQSGDQGSIQGDMYSNSTYGSGKGQGAGSGTSWGLNGRSLANRGQVVPDCNEVGTVVVEIRVDKQGKVISAQHTKGTTNSAKCLTDAAIATAKTFRWKPDDKAPSVQIGFIVINFRLGA